MSKGIDEVWENITKLHDKGNELHEALDRSLSLQAWWPKAFEGDMVCRTRWYGSPARGFRFQALRSDGASKDVAAEDAPEFAGKPPRFNSHTGKVERDES